MYLHIEITQPYSFKYKLTLFRSAAAASFADFSPLKKSAAFGISLIQKENIVNTPA